MNINSACFIGHRNIIITDILKNEIKNLIEYLITHHNVIYFLFGSKSEFNSLCHQIVAELKKKYKNIKQVFFTCKSEYCVKEYEKDKLEKLYLNIAKQDINLLAYDEEFEHKTKYTAGKSSYIQRNKAMIDYSKFCIFYYDENYIVKPKSPTAKQSKSGTKIAYEYAKRKKKIIFNLKKH